MDMNKKRLKSKIITCIVAFFHQRQHITLFDRHRYSLNPVLAFTQQRCCTLLVHCCTVLMSSWITMSTHLRHGPLSFTICFFTMASKAISGVNRPVLQGDKTAECTYYGIPLYIYTYTKATYKQ